MSNPDMRWLGLLWCMSSEDWSQQGLACLTRAILLKHGTAKVEVLAETLHHVSVSTAGQLAIYDAVADGVGYCQAEVRDARSRQLIDSLRSVLRTLSNGLHLRQTRASTPAQELQTDAGSVLFWSSNRDSPWQCEP